jgi:hypothetical protein
VRRFGAEYELYRRKVPNWLERAEQRRRVGVRLVQASNHRRSLALHSKLGFDVRELLLPARNGELFRWCLNQGRAGAAHDLDEPGALQRTGLSVPAVHCVLVPPFAIS